MQGSKIAQQEIVKGPHRWDAETQQYVATGPTPRTVALTVPQELAAILSGPHEYIPGEGGTPGKYVRLAVAAAPKSAEPPAPQPRPVGPVSGQPIRQQAK